MSSESSAIGRWTGEEGRQAYAHSYARAMSLLPVPAATLDIPTSFGSVRVYRWTKKEFDGARPVVLLPGRSSGVPMWVENLPDLVRARTVYALDALGDCGMSVQTKPLRDSADQALWLHEALQSLPIEKAHLAGHSFGGWNAANYASRYPETLASLALLEPVFTFQPVFWKIIVQVMPALPAVLSPAQLPEAA